jgi:predicted nucleotidyltransferase
MEKQLNELVEKLKGAAGANLKSVVLYGSAVSGEFHPKHSDLNVLCVVEKSDAGELARLNPVSVRWVRKGHPPPLVFTLEALQRSADVFAIELLDIKASRRVLFGEDVLGALEVPMSLHRVEVERELRVNLLRLRQAYLAAPAKPKRVLQLMTASVSTFLALFRHALIALGEQAPQQKRDALDRLATLLGFNAAAFHAILDVREGRRRERDVDPEAVFRDYLEGVTRVTNEVDRRIEELSH